MKCVVNLYEQDKEVLSETFSYACRSKKHRRVGAEVFSKKETPEKSESGSNVSLVLIQKKVVVKK